MSHRFLYLTPSGREARIESTEELRRAVARGEVNADTLLHDTEGSSWAPAHTHAIFRLVLEAEEGEQAGDLDDDDLSLALDSVVSDAVEHDDVEAFHEALERERRLERDLDPSAGVEGLGAVRRSEKADALATPESEAATASGPAAPEVALPAPSPGSIRELDVPRWSQLRPPRPPPPPCPPDPRARRARLRRGVLMGVLLLVGGWGIADAWTIPAPDPSVVEPLTLGGYSNPSEPAEGALRVRESARAAFSDMRVGMERIRGRLRIDGPPEAWLTGMYLADPPSAPEVREFWIRYGAFVDSLRTAEEDLFRSGFVARLQERGITGPVLSIRLVRGLEEFRADRARRDTVYLAMERLSREAIAFDDFLREASDRIAYAGVREGAVSVAPELEAAPLDEATRAELNARLDTLLFALQEVTGKDPAQTRDLTGAALEALIEGDAGGTGEGETPGGGAG
ncbi:MAG: hypothetical protein RQ745_02040 [Longimicrobiales bacterium]|nr:hypothetical protein [Longimicrobiales bacterium]